MSNMARVEDAMPDKEIIGRFAPSPTGPLHFGSLVAAVGSYCLARQAKGRWLLRMENLDRPRVVPGAADDILRALDLCGFEWDGDILWQSRRDERYQEVVDLLRSRGLVFDCACSRREIIASAPHVGEEGPIYPGTCRQGLAKGRVPRALRIRVPDEVVGFCDGLFGPTEQHLQTTVGDFILRRADGLFAYQLAVVIDDHDTGVNQVVRGADLIGSTPRQIYLHQCLGWQVPTYLHLPLALDPGGEKLSKRHGAMPLEVSRAGRWLLAALRFLGQNPPADLGAAPPAEILAWGVAHFTVTTVPREAAVPALEL